MLWTSSPDENDTNAQPGDPSEEERLQFLLVDWLERCLNKQVPFLKRIDTDFVPL